MKIKNILTTILLFAIVLPAVAQDDTHDPKAKTILEKVKTTTQGYNTLRASFEFTNENLAEKIHDTKSGYMFVKGEKYKLILSGIEIFTDGKSLWTYSKESKEITVDNLDENEDNIISNAPKIFSWYEKGFKYTLKGEAPVQVKVKQDGKVTEVKKTCYVVDLYPENPKGKEFHTVELIIDKATNQLQSITIKGKNGTNQVIEITEYKPNVLMNDDLFTYDPAKYPGVELNDMR